jgi:hypothetical protein
VVVTKKCHKITTEFTTKGPWLKRPLGLP